VIAALIILALLVLWVFFLAYSALLPRWAKLPPEVKLAGVLVVAVGLVVDVVINLSASFPLAELPQEWTFSQRMGRYKAWAPLRPDHWRVRLACYLCANWLDPFENGGHCRG
jgi:hypothetical protein